MKEKNSNLKLMTAKEVSEFLRIPASTVYHLAQVGKIKGVKLGKHWRFIEDDIVSYLRLKSVLSSTRFISITENRRVPRLNTRIPGIFAVIFNDEQGIERAGVVGNLSEDGLFFVLNASDAISHESEEHGREIKYEVGDPVRIKFEINGLHPCKVDVEGRIVHVQPNSKTGIGIKFRNINPAEQGVIRHYVG